MSYRKILRAAAALVAIGAAGTVSADIVTQWDFNALTVGLNNSPTPSIGSGTASAVGMTNNYTYSTTPTPQNGEIATSDVLALIGSSDPVTPTSKNNAWRVRGSADGTEGTAGTSFNNAAPQYSQGAEFDASTAGYSNIVFKYDWFSTNQAVRDQQAQYTTDGTTWTNVGSLQVATPNAYTNGLTIDFNAQGIHSVDNNPKFGVRLVSAYDPTYTGAGAPTYTSASLSGGVPVQYNNNSGNWRFDMVIVSGTAVPEPGALAVLGIAPIAMLRRRRARD